MPGKARKQKAVHRSKVLIGLCDSCHSLALLNLLTWRCLLMTFICDVIIGVSFKVSFPHLYLLEVWQSQMRLCYKRYTVSGILSLLQKITPEIGFSKPYHRYSLFFKHIWNSVCFLLNIEHDKFGLRRLKASFMNPVFMPLSVWQKIVRVLGGHCLFVMHLYVKD